MRVDFSTNVAAEAEKRVRRAIPDISDSFMEYVSGLVEGGMVRVGDPAMYGGKAPIYPTASCTPEITAELQRRFTAEVE